MKQCRTGIRFGGFKVLLMWWPESKVNSNVEPAGGSTLSFDDRFNGGYGTVIYLLCIKRENDAIPLLS